MDSGNSADTPADGECAARPRNKFQRCSSSFSRSSCSIEGIVKDLLQCAVGCGSLGRDLIDGSH